MTNRIDQAFKKSAFIAFLTAGDPAKQITVEYMKEMEKAGVGLIEIGIPFSDPIAEGPVIQEASLRALEGGMNTDKVFEIVKEFRKESELPVCLMTYCNPVFHYGYEQFFKTASEAGVDGIIIPDVPFEESEEVSSVSEKYNVHFISMLAPTSKERIEMISKQAKGFIYLVSSLGVTGMRDSITTDLKEIVGMVKSYTDVPVCIGFGIHKSEQVKEYSEYADGVIVGSAIVNMIKKNKDQAHQPIYDFCKEMVDALV